jgi:hypothetical protein
MSYESSLKKHEQLKTQETVARVSNHANNLQNWISNAESKLGSTDACGRERLLKQIKSYETDLNAANNFLNRMRGC